MGGSSVNQYLSAKCNGDFDDKELQSELIEFL